MHFLAGMYKLRRTGPYMNYTDTKAKEQQEFCQKESSFLMIPSNLEGFTNKETTLHKACSGREVYCFKGDLALSEFDRTCPECGSRMHINGHRKLSLRHLCFGSTLSVVSFDRKQLLCSKCGHSHMQSVPFKAPDHQITTELHEYACRYLAQGTYTLKQVAEITGLGKNTVKSIDLARLKKLYTVDGKKLIKPEQPARILAIDEFLLHKGYQYATHIIDLMTGHILWISHGKKKKVVYEFIEHVGLEWMESVEAVACDMNSDFQEAFEEKCPWIQPVFDRFHIVKNFNDKVISEVRKDEQRRLYAEGLLEEARALKKTRFILMSSRSTLQAKDEQARKGEPIVKSGTLFPREEYVRKEGYEAKYDELLSQNKLLFTLDLIKDRLSLAYSRDDEPKMADDIAWIMDTCKESRNEHLLWFHNLLDVHFAGVIAHASIPISSGIMEGTNRMIKTIRWQAYGLPDDEYFFLKLFDASRKEYVRNVPSHKICD
jgi:transposase